MGGSHLILYAQWSVGANLTASLAIDTSQLKSSDGQLLLDTVTRTPPSRPSNPSSLPLTDPLHWYDMEWFGYMVSPIDEQGAIQQAQKINQAGIPLLLSDVKPAATALNYAIAWTGPDQFLLSRLLARTWADQLQLRNPTGNIGVAYVQHKPGSFIADARSYGPITELATYAPRIQTLTIASATVPFDIASVKTLVSGWLATYGTDLKGICAADDANQATGIFQALAATGRSDIVVVSAGNSLEGMNSLKADKLFAINR